MKFRRRSPEGVSLNLTPLIDVVFLLLIFFMVSTTFDQTAELDLQLPDARHGQQKSEEATLRLEVAEQGAVLLNGKPVKVLEPALKAFLQKTDHPGRVLVIADERARHGEVTRVLDTLAGLDLTDISFQTRYAP